MNKKISLSILLTSILLLTSCAGKFAPTSDYFTVTPQVLVAQGGKVPATVDGTFPAKAFPTKGIVTITPVLKYEGGEALGTPITLQGEKVTGNNKVISKKGGSFSVSSVFDYIPAMSKSELYLRFKTTIGKKTIEIPEIKVADGVIATETWQMQPTQHQHFLRINSSALSRKLMKPVSCSLFNRQPFAKPNSNRMQ